MNEAQNSQTISAIANPSPLLSSVISALSTDATSFTGERFVFGSGVEIFYEHYHRYIFAARNISSNQIVLDLGCGAGYGSLILASKARKVIAIDRDQDSITILASLLKQLGISNLEPICGDVAALENLVSDPIDVVVCHELIEHLPQHLQEFLVALIASGKGPFHKGTKFLVSTPERNAYNRKNQNHNHFHESEFTESEFRQLLSKHFKNVSFYWQSTITGNIILPEESPIVSAATSYVNWENTNKLLGTVSEKPDFSGIYIYGIASNLEFANMQSSILVDQRELLTVEKLSIAAQELNQAERMITELTAENRASRCRQELEQQTYQKVKDLMRDHELLGARFENAERQIDDLNRQLQERTQHYEMIIKTHIEAPLEVKLAKKCVEKLPNFIRRFIRRFAAIGLAIVRG